MNVDFQMKQIGLHTFMLEMVRKEPKSGQEMAKIIFSTTAQKDKNLA